MRDTDKFFTGEKIDVTLVGVKAKPKENKIWTIRLAFILSLTAEVLSDSPQNVVEAFNAVAKDDLGLNPVGLTSEFDETVVTFYATRETKAPSLEVGSCMLRNMVVERPAKQDEGEVLLRFDLDVPASRDVWNWAYRNYHAEMCCEIESVQMKLNIKAADPDGENEGQGILEMEKSDPAPTTGPLVTLAEQAAAFPDLPEEQRKATKRIKTGTAPKAKKKKR